MTDLGISYIAVVVRALELIEDGKRNDGSIPGSIVAELEITLEAIEADLVPRPIRFRCGNCGLRLRFPGELYDHYRFCHYGQPWRKHEAVIDDDIELTHDERCWCGRWPGQAWTCPNVRWCAQQEAA